MTMNTPVPPRQQVKFSDGEIVEVDSSRLNEIRPLVAGIRFALYGVWPGQAFIRSRYRT